MEQKEIERIVKLIKARDGAEAVGSEEEAKAFAVEITQRLAEFDLSEDEVVARGERLGDGPAGFMHVDGATVWLQHQSFSMFSAVASMVAHYNGCVLALRPCIYRPMRADETGSIRVYARSKGRAKIVLKVVQEVLQALHVACMRHFGSTDSRFRPVRSFVMGFSMTLEDRLAQAHTEAAEAHGVDEKNALMRVNDDVTKLVEQVSKELGQIKPDKVEKPSAEDIDPSAFVRGAVEGRRAPVSPSINDS